MNGSTRLKNLSLFWNILFPSHRLFYIHKYPEGKISCKLCKSVKSTYRSFASGLGLGLGSGVRVRVRVRVRDEKRDWQKTTPPKLAENHAPSHVTLFWHWLIGDNPSKFHLRYIIPQVWIDNSYQANAGNSCSHAHFFSARGTKNTELHGQHVTLPRACTRTADQISTLRST